MKFTTQVDSPLSRFDFSYGNRIFTMGSCFASTIGDKLKYSAFNVTNNPFGTIYHPLAICKLLHAPAGAEESLPVREHYVQKEGRWMSLDLHSSVYANSEELLSEKIRKLMGDAANAIWQSKVLILTFGTALIYRFVKTQKTVANCQKLPLSEFRRELSRVDEISIAVENCIEELRKNNPTLKVMLTVSPVRHLSGGLDENNLSKSILRIACESIQNTLREVYYFPAFEIMMDELRDYRFYKDDLIHPTSFAEQFIWEKFQRSYFSVETIKRLQEVEKIRAALAHKPFHPNSAAHKTFLLDLLQKMKMMEGSVDLVDEIYDLKVKLENWV